MKYICTIGAGNIIDVDCRYPFPAKYTRSNRRFETEYSSYNIGDDDRVITIFFRTDVTAIKNKLKPVNRDVMLTEFVVRWYIFLRDSM